MDSLINKLSIIEKQLENLSSEYSELYKTYSGNTFSSQLQFAEKMENLIHITTHEISTQIGFSIQLLSLIKDYIEFRKVYNGFTENELELIIDTEIIPLELKLELSKKLNTKDLSGIIKNMKGLWNNTFNNKNYKYIKTLIDK